MAQVSIRWDGNGVARLTTAMEGGLKEGHGPASALDHTGDSTTFPIFPFPTERGSLDAPVHIRVQRGANQCRVL
jgi:hypothetical protein